MSDSVVGIVEKLITEFSWRRLFVALLIAIIAFGAFALFESYTGHFRLQRVQETLRTLAAVVELEAKAPESREALRGIHQRLLAEAAAATEAQSPWRIVAATASSAADKTLLKFLLGGSVWWLLAISSAVTRNTTQEKRLAGFAGGGLFAVIFGGIGVAIPTVWWPWLNLVVYPLAHFFVLLFLMLVFGYRLSKRAETRA